MRRTFAPALMVGLLLGLVGCDRGEEPVRLLRPQVQWSDLAATPVGNLDEGFVILAPGGTDGAFPTSIAVARVAQEGAGRVVMDMTPRNEFLAWNTALENLRYVSEAFPLHQRALQEEQPEPERLVTTARELRAGMCLVYGRGDVTASEAEVRGVLYLAATGQPVAALRARALVTDPEAIPHPPEHVDDDLRHCDPRVLADRQFEQVVVDCLRALRAKDRPVQTGPPEGWVPDQPLEPRVWPPSPMSKSQ